MRKMLALVALLMIPATELLAQDGTTMNSNAVPPPIVKPSRDFVMLQLNYVNWLKKPDSINTKGFGYGFNGFVCYDFPIKRSRFSFATGLGVSVDVVYLNQQQIVNTDTMGIYNLARFLPNPLSTPDSVTIKRYKFVTTYLQAPFELRYFGNPLNRNKGFKAAIGMQIGTLLGSDAKELASIGGTNVKFKTDTKRYVSPWNFAATARIGWGNFSLFGSYNLTNVFKTNEGPAVAPVAAGICITGL